MKVKKKQAKKKANCLWDIFEARGRGRNQLVGQGAAEDIEAGFIVEDGSAYLELGQGHDRIVLDKQQSNQLFDKLIELLK